MWKLSFYSSQFNLPSALLPPSIITAELWKPQNPKGRALLDFPQFQSLEFLCELFPLNNSPTINEYYSKEIHAEKIVTELKHLTELLKKNQESLPFRYWFGTDTQGQKTPTPIYSERKLSTGQLYAGFNLCAVNRNWDGNDRFEDLTERTEIIEDIGVIPIVKQSAGSYLLNELNNITTVLNLLPPKFPIQLKLTHLGDRPKKLLLGIINVAEKARKRFGIPDYSEKQLQKISQLWKKMILKKGNFSDLALLIAAYFSEFIRIRIPGAHYQRIDDLNQKKKPLEPSPFQNWRGVVLKLPFLTDQQLFSKIERAYFYRRPFPWELHYQSTLAHRRQTDSILLIYQNLYKNNKENFLSTLRIILSIRDIRSYQLAALLLMKEEDPLSLNSLLKLFLNAPPITLPKKRLFALILSKEPAISNKAIYITSKYWPRLFAQNLPKLRSHLPPERQYAIALAIKKNKEIKIDKKFAKQFPKSKQTERELLHSGPTIQPAPILCECIENTANPVTIKTALTILNRYKAPSELEQLGQALADPDPSFRIKVIGILRNSSHQKVKELLKSRTLFENNPLCRKILREIQND